ncbi:hypothetical protein WJX72_011244 [[Myrmecia] bisecta]|uniref:EGF-like domain-containing protein n=1 Tax=[Myrmecia] bisecta TaxID=41462 RepID=A0AAW1PHA9_9CHLO
MRPTQVAGSNSRMWLLSVATLLLAVSSAEGAAFLEDQLPLTILQTTPVQLADAAGGQQTKPITVTGRQALTVVYSRAVIALGSDFGVAALPASQIPFTFSKAIPGDWRWVTTYIARWDPAVDWPTDLNITLNWNTNLTAYDGATLQLNSTLPVQLTTALLSMTLRQVNYALVLPAGTAYNALAGPLAKDLRVPFYGLRTFRLPFNTDPKAYPTAQSALDTGNGLSYRRLSMWLPHGLANSTSLGDLQSAITLEEVPFGVSSGAAGTAVPFNLSRTSAGTLRLDAPLQPSTQYRISVADSPNVKDGFGLPLKASTARFFMSKVSDVFAEPAFSGSGAMVEAGTNWGGKWPVITQGQPADRQSLSAWPVTPAGLPGAISAWTNSTALTPLLGAASGSVKASGLDGASLLELDAAKALASSGVALLQDCCSPNSLPGDTYAYQPVWLTEADMSAAFLTAGPNITAWVTSLADGAPISGAAVSFYTASSYSAVRLVANGTTDGNGTVTVSLGQALASAPDLANNGLTAVVQRMGDNAKGRLLVVNNVATSLSASAGDNVKGALVIDRLLAKPGEAVYVQGYILSQSGATLSPAQQQNARLEIPDLWTNSANTYPEPDPIQIPVTIDPTYGSFNATVIVPSTASPGLHHIQLVWGGQPAATTTPSGVTAVPLTGSAAATMANTGVNGGIVAPTTTTTLGARPNSGRKLAQASGVAPIRVSPAAPTSPPSARRSPSPSPSSRAGSPPRAVSPPSTSSPSSSSKVAGGGASRSVVPPKGTTQPATPQTLATISVTVGDPRPPTAALTLTAPTWSKYGDVVPVHVHAESYIGATVGGAQMQLSWKIGSFAASNQSVTVDAQGDADVPIDLAALNSTVADMIAGRTDQALAITVNWVGPTRELITQTASVRLAKDELSVALVPSLTTDLPGVEFGVYATVTSIATLLPVGGLPVSLQLYRNRTDAAGNETAALDAVPASGCKVQSGDKAALSSCRVKLPAIGSFVMEGCLPANGTAVPICARLGLGRNLSSWQALPLSQAPNVQQLQASISVPDQQRSFPSSITINPGPQTDLSAGNLTAVDNGLAVLAPGDSAAVQVSVQLPKGFSALPGASAIATVIIVDKAILDQVPYPLPDLSQPLALDLSQSIGSVTSLDSGLIAPFAIQNMTAVNLRRLSLDPWLNPDTTVLPGSPVYSYGSQSSAAVDTPDAAYLARYVTQLTVFPNSFNPGVLLFEGESGAGGGLARTSTKTQSGVAMPTAALASNAVFAAAAAPSPASDSAAGGGGGQSAPTPRIQAAFVPTVLVQTVSVDANGMARVNFTAPQKLSTYVVRAYTATSTAQYSSSEAQVQVARQISLTPSAPRLVRVGDTFEAGVVVTLRSTAADSLPVRVDLSGIDAASPIKLSDGGFTTSGLTINSTSPTEVRFRFVAAAIGSANLTLSVTSQGGAADSLQITIPVEGLQESVRVASSFAVQAVLPNATAAAGPFQGSAQEGLALPAAAPGSGSIDIVAGVGHLPAVKAIAADLAEDQPDRDADYRATWALATLLGRSILELYEGQSDAGDAVLTAVNASASAAATHLANLTDPTYGLLYSPTQPGFLPPQSADVHLNAWGLWITSQIGKSSQLDAAVLQLRPIWQTAMITQLLKDAEYSRRQYGMPYGGLEQLAEVHLVLGPGWLPAVCPATGPCSTKQVQADLSMDRVEQGLEDKLSLSGQAIAALAWLADGSPASLDKALRAVRLYMSDIRVGGRTAYIASSPGGQYPAGLESQALALLAANQVLSGNTTANPLVEKLANYVAARQGYNGAGPIPFAFGGELAAAAMLALQEYDLSKGSILPDMTLQVQSGNVTLLNASFQGLSSPDTVTNNVSWSALDLPAPEPVTFAAVGRGEASVALSLDFIPNATFPFPIYHGLQVERIIRLTDPANLTGPPIGPALATIPLGSIVAFTVRLTTPDKMGPSELHVLMPGGLEPLDPNINTALGSSCVLANLGISFSWWPWPVCPVQETLPAVVTFKYQRLLPGSQEVTFRAVAASVGQWSLPPAKAFVTDQPEVMGLSAAGSLEVCDGCTAQPVPAAATPSKACPRNCSGAGGLCNLDTGVCLCNPGYAGDDCSQVTIF